jgi:hypothetical protein
MMQASARIGCFASNIGAAAGVLVAWSEKLGVQNVTHVPTMLVQWTLAANLSTAITFFLPPLQEFGSEFAALQIAGAYAVPPMLDIGTPSTQLVSTADLDAWLPSYRSGILTGVIKPATPNQPPSGCLPNGSWYAYTPDWEFSPTSIEANTNPSYECPLGALLKKCLPKSTTLPAEDVRCFPPGTHLGLSAPPQKSPTPELDIVQPIFASARPETSKSDATRKTLFSRLNSIAAGTATSAMQEPSIGTSALSFTILDLAQIVTRHAAVMRNLLHGEDVMGPLALEPYTFPADTQ